MVKQLTKLFLVGVLAIGFLSAAEVAEADLGSKASHEAKGQIENTLNGVCSNDWCTEYRGMPLYCSSVPMPDVCRDLDTYCKEWKSESPPNPETEGVDSHGKRLPNDCGVYLADKKVATDQAGIAQAKKDLEDNYQYNALSYIDELQTTITAAEASDKASGVTTKDLAAAKGKLEAANTAKATADKKKDDPIRPDFAQAEILYDKAAQFAKDGLALLGVAPSANSAGDSGKSSSGGSAPARTISGPGLVTPPSGIQGISGLVSAEQLAVGILNFFLSFVAIIAVAILIYGGFLYITAAGDTAKSGKGKTVIAGAVIGILIIIGSWTVVNTVINLQGGTGGGGAGSAVIAKSAQVTISGTTLLGQNVHGTVTVYQGQGVTAQLTGDTLKGFLRNTAEIEVALDGATILIGGEGGASIPAKNAQQVDIGSVGSLRKGKADVTILQQ